MRIDSISYNKLNSYTQLFLDFIQNKNNIVNICFNNELDDLVEKHNYNNDFREVIIKVIKNTTKNIDLSDNQSSNLKDLIQKNSFTITTGQQIGFLGGSLYTFYKIITIISECIKYKNKFPEYNFIPIFWLEDNDHDQIEATESFYLSKDKMINKTISKENPDNSEHLVSAYLENSDYTIEQINEFFENLPFSDFKEELKEKIIEFYSTKFQKDSFLKILNSIFSDFGVLFLSGNELRKSGVSKEIVKNELLNYDSSNKIIDSTNENLISNKYSVQSINSGTKLFYHIDNKRFKVNIVNDDFLINNIKYSKAELLKIADEFPDRFSPNVLLRCIVQEYTLPNLAYIAGPGEINYWAQTKELFTFFEVQMPKIIPRHSVTLISLKIEKLISKLNLSIDYFFRTFNLIDIELKVKHHSDKLENLFNESKNQISQIFENLKREGILLDKTLEQTVDGSYQKSLNFIDILEKKFESANFKLSNEENQKYREVNNYIYPNGKLQERVFNILSVLNTLGYVKFKELVFEIINSDNLLHQIIYLD